MVRNPQRRDRLLDAGIAVLAREGARGLTHRAVDREAGLPLGTASNYFRARGDLIAGLVERIGQRLRPDPERLVELGAREPGRELLADYLRYIVERLTRDPDVAFALVELRLESVRRPEVGEVVARWQREGFAADVAFNEAAGLPGGRHEIALLHYAIDGLVLDMLTHPIAPDLTSDEVVERLVELVALRTRGRRRVRGRESS